MITNSLGETATLTSPFTVNTQDWGSSLNQSETILQIGGGYVGATNPLDGYANVNTINAPNTPILQQIQNFISKNPILTALGGVAVLLVLKSRR